MTMRFATLILLLAMLGGLAPSAIAGGTIELRPVARVQADGPVTLGDVAVLTGDAEVLVSLVVQERADGDTVALAAVREIVNRSSQLAPSALTFRGSTCRLIVLRPRTIENPNTKDEATEATPTAVPDTVQWHIERSLMRALGVPADRLRLAFDPRDREMLRQSTIGRSVLARPLGMSSQTPVSLTIYEGAAEGDRLVERRVLRVGVLILRDAAVATRALSRGAVLDASKVRAEQRWIGPGQTTVPLKDALGLVLRSPVNAGQAIGERVVQQPVLVERGQIIEVHCVIGTVQIVERARALRDATKGQVIAFESIDGKRRTFDARVERTGVAMLVTGARETAAPPETKEATP